MPSLPKLPPLPKVPSSVLCLDLARHCGAAFIKTSCPDHPGLPLVVACKTIDFGSHTVKRWITLQAEIETLFNQFSPDAVIIEKNFIFKNVKTTASLNQLLGAVLLLCALRNIKVEFIDNNSAKSKLLGGTRYWDPSLGKYVGVTKDMMQTAVNDVLCKHSVTADDHDSADAVALGLTFFDTPVTIITPLARKPKAAPVAKKKVIKRKTRA